MSAGAFSDPKVIQAAERIVCIFVDCDWGKKNSELSALFKVKGYPTVILCNPDGKTWGTLTSRDPEGVEQHLLELAAKGPAKPAAPVLPPLKLRTFEEALPLARKSGRPILLYAADDSPASLAINLALGDGLLKETLLRFVPALVEYRKGSAECTRFEVTRAPTILVLDASLPKPEEKPLARIEGSRSARDLKRELEGLRVAGTAPPSGPTPDAPPTKQAEETLSDDEVDQRFIQARVTVAQALAKQGKKDKAIAIYEDLLKSHPKHVYTKVVKELLEEARK